MLLGIVLNVIYTGEWDKNTLSKHKYTSDATNLIMKLKDNHIYVNFDKLEQSSAMTT